jgi:hypothetical protein
LAGLVAMAGILWLRSFNIAASNIDANTHFQMSDTCMLQRQTLEAITHCTEGLRLAERVCQLTDYQEPQYVGTLATVLNHLACVRATCPQVEFRDGPEAVRLAERACQLTGYQEPRYVGTLAAVLDSLAWMRATSPRAEFRDGPEAVRLAERACQLTGYKEPRFDETLAAAYAETGRFDEAVAVLASTRELALARGENGLAERNLKFIELYKLRQPFRDADQRDELRTGNQGVPTGADTKTNSAKSRLDPAPSGH